MVILSASKSLLYGTWGRSATGVRGVNLRPGDQVVGASVITDQDEVLIITEKGYGKRTRADEYPTKGRGGKGIKLLMSSIRMVLWLVS